MPAANFSTSEETAEERRVRCCDIEWERKMYRRSERHFHLRKGRENILIEGAQDLPTFPYDKSSMTVETSEK
jgi:hypothetical protein